MQMLPKWVLPPTQPSIYDCESHTAIEMVAKLYGAMRTLIEEYNTFADTVNANIKEYQENTAGEVELFGIGLRQEFQDFIDTVELELKKLNADTLAFTKEIVNKAIKAGEVTVVVDYNEVTESLSITTTGGV